MHNKIILLIFLGTVFQSFASKVFDVHFSIDDAYTSEPMAHVEIEVSVEKKGEYKQLGIGKTDATGKLELKNIDGSIVHIKVVSPNDNYANKEFDYFTNRGKDCRLKLSMYPSEAQLQRWLTMENANYGLSTVGSLDAQASDFDFAFGCDKDFYVEAFYDSIGTAAQNYFKKNLRYPLESLEQGEQGRVFAKFVIEKDGKLSHIEIIRSVSPTIDQEAIRLLRSMDLWNPAKCSGQKIRTRGELSINFELEY